MTIYNAAFIRYDDIVHETDIIWRYHVESRHVIKTDDGKEWYYAQGKC